MYAPLLAITIAAFSAMGEHPCPFPTRVCHHPEEFFGTCLRPAGIFEEGFSSILLTMNERPLVESQPGALVVRVVIWPSLKLPTMSRFRVADGTIIEVSKGLRFASRTALPDVTTSSVVFKNDKARLAKRLRGIPQSCTPANQGLEEDGACVLVEISQPGKPYRAYYFQDSQNLQLYRQIVELIDSH